jgi:glutamate synthase (NADPH/NADH) small chain
MPREGYMKKQDPKTRATNFNEVALGFTKDQAIREAKRCLICKKPKCVAGCPVEIDIPGFISKIKDKDFAGAAKIVKEKNSLPAMCGRVCPQEDQCEKECILGKKDKPINIGALERFAADWELNHTPRGTRDEGRRARDENTKVAVIGSGPAGLTCAADLAKMGYQATLFESLHKPGGVLVYGIPNFRLPKDIIEIEVDYIRSLGVALQVNTVVGKSVTVDELRSEGFQAFFIATGAGLPYFLGIDGENLNGVYSANEFLTRINLMKAYRFPEYDTPIKIGRHVGVVGAGNVAMDSARCALRLGAERVTIIYRRSEKEMPARADEIDNAKEEGIAFDLLTNPLRIFSGSNGWIEKIECIRNELGPPDESGRRRPVPIPGSEFIMDIDTLVCAIGQGPNPLLLSTLPNLQLTRKGTIAVDGEGKTNIPDIWAGGDIATGAATVIVAMGAGKKVARSIDTYLRTHKD